MAVGDRGHLPQATQIQPWEPVKEASGAHVEGGDTEGRTDARPRAAGPSVRTVRPRVGSCPSLLPLHPTFCLAPRPWLLLLCSWPAPPHPSSGSGSASGSVPSSVPAVGGGDLSLWPD